MTTADRHLVPHFSTCVQANSSPTQLVFLVSFPSPNAFYHLYMDHHELDNLLLGKLSLVVLLSLLHVQENLLEQADVCQLRGHFARHPVKVTDTKCVLQHWRL